MSIDVRPSNRHCALASLPVLSVPAMQADLLAHRGVQSGFTLLYTPAPVSDEVIFKVYTDGDEITVAALLMRRPAPGALLYGQAGETAAVPDDECVELFFDPRHDHAGYFQFCFASAGGVERFQHLPYAEAHSTAFPWLDVRGQAWEPYLDCGRQCLGVWFFARFGRSDIFRHGDVCGFNLARTRSGITEYGSWNHCSGHGFPDATSFGHLHATAPADVLAITRDDFSDGTLALSGTGTPGRLLDPAGDAVDAAIVVRDDRWELTCRPGPLHGLYRLYPALSTGEPHYLAFTLSGADKPEPFRLGMTYDYPDNLISYPFTPEGLGKEFSLLQQCGVNRLYWIDYPLSMLKTDLSPAYPHYQANIASTEAHCGEVLPLAARLAAERGMEFFGVYKVFDLGTGDHPEWAMGRNPAWAKRVVYPITAVRLYSQQPPGTLDAADITLWVSDDNRSFTPYRGPFSVRQAMVRRPHLRQSPAGNLPEDGAADNYLLEITGLALEAPYLAIETPGRTTTFTHRAFAFVEATDGCGGEAPVTPGHGSRERGFTFTADWGWGNRSERVLDLFTWHDGALGLCFADHPYASWDGHDTAVLPEPACDGVHDWWLAGIRKILDTPASGVDIRILCHHVLARDYLAAAFAEPVCRAFRARYGRVARPEPEDYRAIRRLRGEAFTRFLRRASELTRARGKRLIVHLEPGQEVSPDGDVRMQIAFEWERWIAHGLVDEITLKFWGAWSPFVHERILPLARKQGIPVSICDRNAALGNARGIERGERMVREAMAAGFAGFFFYESADYMYLNGAETPTMLYNVEAALRQAAKQVEAGANRGPSRMK